MNILAIDQGTSATKALVLGPGNEVLGSAEEPVHPASTPDGGVEQDPEELYRSVLGAGTAALAAAGASVPDSGGAVFVPALAGLGAPHWRPDARGAFLGLGLGVTRAHLARAVIEGIAASVALLAASVTADLGAPLGRLPADGGLTRSRLLVQAQADLLQAPVEVSRSQDATALGVAALARLGTGERTALAEAVGQAEVEWVAEPAITTDQAAERLSVYNSAIQAVLAVREAVPR